MLASRVLIVLLASDPRWDNTNASGVGAATR
jgi:hypothetical protein